MYFGFGSTLMRRVYKLHLGINVHIKMSTCPSVATKQGWTCPNVQHRVKILMVSGLRYAGGPG